MPKSFDRYPQKRGVGNSLYNPLRSGIQGWTDPLGAIDEAAQRAGTGIRQRLEDGLDQVLDGIVATVLDVTGIDISGPVALLEQLIGIPLAFLDSTSLGDAVDVLGQFFPFLPGANAGTFDPGAAAASWIESSLLPLKLLLGWNDPLNAANLFGLIQMPQLAGGVSIADLTTATSNLLQPFTAGTATDWGDGWSFNVAENAAQVIADGTTKTLWLRSGVIKVEEGQPLNTNIPVRYAGIVSGAGPTIRYVMETFASADGSGPMTPVTVAAVTNPSGTITTPVTLGDTSWDIPPGVQSVRPALVVDELVTAGTVYWKNPPHLHKILLGVLADGIASAIQARINEIQATWDAFKGSAGGTVSDIQAALNKAGQDTRDAIANALGHPGTGHTPAQILGYLMNIPQSAVSGLEDVFGELADILDDQIVDPLTAVGNKLRDLVHRFFFGGGPDTVVSQKQIAEPSGIVPTDANTTIPWIYLPPELTPAALGHPWVELTKVGAQTLNRTAATKLTGWTQAGGFPLTNNINEFKVPFDGLFHIKARIGWAVSPDTYGTLRLDINGNTYRSDRRLTDGMSNLAYNEIDEFVALSASDTFIFFAQWDGTGTTRDISASPGSYVRITYIGATHLTATAIPTPTVTFDTKGTADNGSGDGGPWNHTFGPNAKTIVIPFSHEAPEMPTISCGPYNVPVLSGPTYIGNYFGFNARYSLAAAILPDAVKGTTQPITVDFPSGNAAFSGNSLSFNNVAYLGTVRTSTGNGGAGDPARILVPSNAFSQVAGGFGGMDVNFSSFNRTQDNIWNFIAGNTWAHVMGHAQGGLEFLASGGKWAGKFIELHP